MGASDPPSMQQQIDFCPWVGGLVRGHIAMDVFSEECLPCLSPTTVLVLVPDAWLHILFTLRKRRKNEEIEAHSLHAFLLLDAEISPLARCWISLLNRSDRPVVFTSLLNVDPAGSRGGDGNCSCHNNQRFQRWEGTPVTSPALPAHLGTFVT